MKKAIVNQTVIELTDQGELIVTESGVGTKYYGKSITDFENQVKFIEDLESCEATFID